MIGGFQEQAQMRAPPAPMRRRPPRTPATLPEFSHEHLRLCPPFSSSDYSDIHRLRDELLAKSSIPNRSKALAALLNKISDCAHKFTNQPHTTGGSKSKFKALSEGDRIRFADRSTTQSALPCWRRYQARQARPSVFGTSKALLDEYYAHYKTEGEGSIQFPIHHIHTAIEIQGDISMRKEPDMKEPEESAKFRKYASEEDEWEDVDEDEEEEEDDDDEDETEVEEDEEEDTEKEEEGNEKGKQTAENPEDSNLEDSDEEEGWGDSYDEDGEVILPEECKIQTAVYLGDILRARHDLIGAYGLFVTAEHYSVMWADPTGSCKSPKYLWSSLGPLLSYVWSLYFPLDDRACHDKTMSLDVSRAVNDGIDGEPGRFAEYSTWNFTYFPGMKFKCLYVGDPFTRGTAVFREIWYDYENIPGDPFIIKDRYFAKSCYQLRTKEAELIKQVHHLKGKPSPVPGVVRGVCLPPLEATIPRKGTVEPRIKSRMLLFDSGISLQSFDDPHFDGGSPIQHPGHDSVAKFLHTMYDSLEAHRTAVERGVLHRNICPGNIYRNPTFMCAGKILSVKHLIQPEDLDWLIAPWGDFNCVAHFIHQKATWYMPSAMLADFGDATQWPPEDASDNSRKEKGKGKAPNE